MKILFFTKIPAFLTTVFLFLSLAGASAQTPRTITFLEDDFSSFSSQDWGQAWDKTASNAAYVTKSSTKNAGGISPELVMGYNASNGLNNDLNGTAYFCTKAMELTRGNAYLSFRMRFKADKAVTSRDFGVCYKKQGESGWTVLFNQKKPSQALPTSVSATRKILGIPDSLINAGPVVFAFYLENTKTDNGKYTLYLDDVILASYPDECVVDFDYNGLDYHLGSEYDAVFTIANAGSTTVDSCRINYTVDGSEPETFAYVFANGLKMFGSQSLSVPVEEWSALEPGKHGFSFYLVSLNGDTVDGPDTVRYEILKVGESDQAVRTPLLEVFTSVNCNPCANNNSIINPRLEEWGKKVSFVKFHTSAVGADSYATDASDDRFYDLYGGGGVPSMQINGDDYGSSGNNVLSVLSKELESQPKTYVKIAVDSAVVDTNRVVTVSFNVQSAIEKENLKVFAVIVQKIATQHPGRNGEKEFHHVMLAMEEAEWGYDKPVEMGKKYDFPITFDLKGTMVENERDLQLVCFVQEESKNVLQSTSYDVTLSGNFSDTPEECGVPTELEAVADTLSASLSWKAGENNISFVVRYKEATADEYAEVASVADSVVLEGLDALTAYVWSVRGVCSQDSSAFAADERFTTLGKELSNEAPGAMAFRVLGQRGMVHVLNPEMAYIDRVEVYAVNGTKLKDVAVRSADNVSVPVQGQRIVLVSILSEGRKATYKVYVK